MFMTWCHYVLYFEEESMQETFTTKAFKTSRKFEN